MPRAPGRLIAGLLAGLTLLGGCSPRWLRTPDPSDLGANPRQRVQVFSGGRPHELHSIRVNPDTISGVPFINPPGCESCRVRFARSSVDSVRVVNPADTSMLALGLGICVALVLLFTACQPGGCVPGR